jgi:hypothetical protein
MKLSLVILIIFLCCSLVFSQEDTLRVKQITLKDGSQLIGRITAEDTEKIKFKTSSGVEMEIKRDLIEKIQDVELEVETVAESRPGAYQVGDHELLLMPTGYTMQARQSYLTNYELFFLNYSYAPTNSTHISAFSLFPITKDFLETFTFGVKQQFLNSESVKAALWGTYTPKISGLTFGTVFSIGSGPDGLHLAISAANSLDREDSNSDKWEWIYMAGYRLDISQKISLIAEYTNFSAAVEEDFNGLISFGVRFRGESITWDLAGIRPLEGTGDFFLFPLLKATFLFD